MDVYTINNEENIDQKSGKNRWHYPYTLSVSYSLSYKIFFSPFNSGRHSENADAIADVKSKIIVSRQHFFVDVIYPAT